MSEEVNKTADEVLQRLINQTRNLVGSSLFDVVVRELEEGENENKQSRNAEMLAVVFFTYGNLIKDFNRILAEHDRLVTALAKLPCVQEGLHRASLLEDLDSSSCHKGKPN